MIKLWAVCHQESGSRRWRRRWGWQFLPLDELPDGPRLTTILGLSLIKFWANTW